MLFLLAGQRPGHNQHGFRVKAFRGFRALGLLSFKVYRGLPYLSPGSPSIGLNLP